MTDLLHHVVRPGSGKVGLLLVHALGADHRMWDDFIAAWDRPEPVVACDLRNAGVSARSSVPLAPADHAADLEALRLACGLERVVPVGCAIGAMIAAAYAARHPETTAGLVLTNPALRTVPTARAMLAERAETVRREGLAAVMPGAAERAFVAQPRDARYARWVERFSAQDAEAYALSILGVLDADVSEDLRSLQCPSLVIAGAHDVLLPPDLARDVHALIPRARFALDPDAAHFLPYQNPQGLRDLVADFLDADVLPGTP